MEDVNAVPAWGEPPPALGQSMWEDMLNELLQDPVAEAVAREQTVDEVLQGLAGGSLEDFVGLGDGSDSGCWWTAAPVDLGLDSVDLADLDNTTFIVDEDVSLPGLSSEVSSLAGADLCGQDVPKSASLDSHGRCEDEGGVSSPESCSGVHVDRAPSSNSRDESGNGSSRSHSPIVTSCSYEGAASPDAGCDSSDAGAMGRSCDNFAEESGRASNDQKPSELDEDAMRQKRLMRNRESATQSRLRKKSYIKELEAKCRAMESQMSMLHQTVAFTSAQNAALREELVHYRCLDAKGSKSGATEPAALPSDSLPSESPSRRTTSVLSVKLALPAFLCHVLLLTLFQALPQKPATSEGRAPSEVRRGRRHPCFAVNRMERDIEAARQLKKRQCSSHRRRKRTVWPRSPKSAMFSLTLKPGRTLAEQSSSLTKRQVSSKRSLRRVSRRCQYSSLA